MAATSFKTAYPIMQQANGLDHPINITVVYFMDKKRNVLLLAKLVYPLGHR